MKQLLRKDYRLTVCGKVIEYKQLTYKDALEFDYLLKEEGFSPYEWVVEFLRTEGLKDKEIATIDIMKFWQTYLDTALRGMYGSSDKKSDVPPSSFIVFVAEKLNIDPLSMIEKYTPEAINFLAEGIEWNINAQTKEGQMRNERKLHAKQLQEGDTEAELASIKAKQEKRKQRALQNNKD